MAIRCKITGVQKVLPAEDGSCPECTTPAVKVTGKGFVAAHDVKINLGEGPQIPVTDEGARVGDPRDAAVRREIEGNKVRSGREAAPKDSTADPVVTTGHGRGAAMYRGRAMPPVQPQKGWSAAAGTMAGPIGRERTEPEEFVGGSAYGYLTQGQYRKLSRTQQRKYWDRVGRSKAFAAERRRKAAESRVSVESEVKRLRELGKASA